MQKFLRQLISRGSYKRSSITEIPILIPARAGSKRLPNKNLSLLNGQPLIYWTIKSCRAVSNRVVVSSDSDKILQFAKTYGAIPLKRPKSLATDDASSESVVNHFLSKFPTDTVVLVQPTSPLVGATHISEAIEKFRNVKYDSVIGVTKFRGKIWSLNVVDGSFSKTIESPHGRNSDFVFYKEAGAVYVTSSRAILNGSRLINGKVGLVEIPISSSIDIDEYEDLALAELIMKGKVVI